MAGIMSIFAQSPFEEFEAHMTIVHQACLKLSPFFAYVMQEDWEKARPLQKEISDMEDKADTLKRMIRMHIPSSILLPVPRTDLLELINSQDSLINKAEDISGIVIGRSMCFPEPLQDLFTTLLARSLDAVEQANRVVHELSGLQASGFRGYEAKLVGSMVQELSAIENDTDVLQVSLRDALFKIEKELHPVDVIFLYKAIEWTGDLGNRAQHVGEKLLLLIAH